MSIHENTILVALSISLPPASRVARSASTDVERRYKTGHRQARVTKSLFSKQDVKQLQQIASQSRIYVNDHTLPYGATGQRILSTEKYFDFVEGLGKFRDAFDTAKKKFIQNYFLCLSRAEFELGDLFNASNYPTEHELEQRIGFSIESQVIPVSNQYDKLAGFDEDTIEKLKAEAKVNQEKALAEALGSLVSKLAKALNHAAVKLGDEDAVFRNTLVGNIEDAVQSIKDLNLTNDPDLDRIAEEAESLIDGLTADDLRKDVELRQEVADKSRETLDKISEFF